jgi:hypothetical protein
MEMVTVAFSDDIVNASELRSRQKYWLEKASSGPVTVMYGARKLAIIDRNEVYNLYRQKHYTELVIKHCEEVLKGSDSRVFPWLCHLDDEEREEFHSDLITGMVRTIVTGDWSDIDELIEDWLATAEAKRDTDFIGELKKKVSREDYIPVE